MRCAYVGFKTKNVVKMQGINGVNNISDLRSSDILRSG
jgi:hypothetical protein